MADVTLPSLGESVTEGIITQWFKKVGDAVARDEPLFEVSTDKVDSEMPSPATGVLTEILAEEGDTVQTGSRVAVIDELAVAGASTSPSAPSSGDVAVASPTSHVERAMALTSTGETSAKVSNGVVISPVVRRILADGGVEASTLTGSGPGGAITRRDAERALLDGPTEEKVVPLSNGRRRMGQHMTESAQVTPHGFVAIEVDGAIFQKLDELGRSTRDGFEVSDEMLVSIAAVRALGEFEFLNATYTGDELVVHRSVNLGFVRAVADDGMLVPVVHAAAGLTLRAVARRVRELD
ncbi:MAG: biotin/lipoyl-containing protein, partial [Acidimicrobiales bacterium]